MNDKGADLSPITRRKVQVAIARKLGLKVDEAFPLGFGQEATEKLSA